MSLPEFHTYREACECIESGGAAHRFGSFYPLYTRSRRGSGDIERRFWGGSGGECGTVASFSLEEQQSTNWVLIAKAEWEARESQMAEAYRALRTKREGLRASEPTAAAPKSFLSRLLDTLWPASWAVKR